MDAVIKALAAWSAFILNTATRKLLSSVIVDLLDLMLELGDDDQRRRLLAGLQELIKTIREARSGKHYRTTPFRVCQHEGSIELTRTNGRTFK